MAKTLITDSSTTDSTDLSAISFTSSIDSTYKLYMFEFYDINPANDSQEFTINGSIDGGSNYNVAKTTAPYVAYQDESNNYGSINYQGPGGVDANQQTAAQWLTQDQGNGADESSVGTVWIFNPSNTTYVKHFIADSMYYHGANIAYPQWLSGYFNTTSAINAVTFAMASGNFDGVVKMYGVA